MIPKETQRQIVRKYEDGISPKKLIEEYGLASRTCYRIIRRGTNVKVNHARRKYRVKKDYFTELNTELKLYTLGLIYTDGCIYKTVLDIVLKSGDEYILKRISNDIFFDKDRPLRFIEPKLTSHVGCYRLYISSIDITNSLLKEMARFSV